MLAYAARLVKAAAPLLVRPIARMEVAVASGSDFSSLSAAEGCVLVPDGGEFDSLSGGDEMAATPARPPMEQSLARNLAAPRRMPIGRRGPRTDWSVSHNMERMNAGITEWLQGRFARRSNDGLRKFCKAKALPYTTVSDRLRKPDPFAVPVLGAPHLFSDEARSAIVDAVAAFDHLNKGKDTQVTSTFAPTHAHTHTHTHTHMHTHTHTHTHTLAHSH
jgi:hypothetical protein